MASLSGCFFLQKPYRIILGPPKHVLHLVWSVLGISTAIKTALKVALYDFFDGPPAPLNGQFMEKVNYYNRTKQIFFNGTKCKICFGNHNFNFPPKKGGEFFSRKVGHKGGKGGSNVPKTQKIPFFLIFPLTN